MVPGAAAVALVLGLALAYATARVSAAGGSNGATVYVTEYLQTNCTDTPAPGPDPPITAGGCNAVQGLQYPYRTVTCIVLPGGGFAVNRTAWLDNACTRPALGNSGDYEARHEVTYPPNQCVANPSPFPKALRFTCTAVVSSSTGVAPPAVHSSTGAAQSSTGGGAGPIIDCFGVPIFNGTVGPSSNRSAPTYDCACDQRLDCWQFNFDGEECLYRDDHSSERVVLDAHDCHGAPYDIALWNNALCDAVLNCSAKNWDRGFCNTTAQTVQLPPFCMSDADRNCQPVQLPPAHCVDPTAGDSNAWAAATWSAVAVFLLALGVWCVWHRQRSKRQAERERAERAAGAQFVTLPLSFAGASDSTSWSADAASGRDGGAAQGLGMLRGAAGPDADAEREHSQTRSAHSGSGIGLSGAAPGRRAFVIDDDSAAHVSAAAGITGATAGDNTAAVDAAAAAALARATKAKPKDRAKFVVSDDL